MKRSRIPLWTTLLVMAFFYLPIVVLVVNSFNAAKYGGAWRGFTLHWYGEVFADRKLLVSIWNSVYVAAGVVVGKLGTATVSPAEIRSALFKLNGSKP